MDLFNEKNSHGGQSSNENIYTKTVQQLFEEQVLKYPSNIALVFEDRKLTYKELNERSNQLAHYLKTLGVGPEIIVGLCLERSLEIVIAILAVLKAGGAYLPLDLSHPEERILYMLEDSKSEILITQNSLINVFSKYNKKIININDIADLLKNKEICNLQPSATINNLAYIIYTSGSTGKPKGIMLEHHTLSNLIFWQNSEMGFCCKAMTHFSNFSFDVSLQELFYAICFGSTLYVLSQQKKTSLLSFVELIIKNKIELIYLPTAILDYFCTAAQQHSSTAAQQHSSTAAQQHSSTAAQQHEFVFLKKIIVAGEALKATKAISAFFSNNTNITLGNHYGPSESHVVTFKNSSNGKISTLIGLPIFNTKLFILDQNLEQVTAGEMGELYISGDCLARGYLNRPDLTAAKFINNPFASAEDKQKGWNRLYKTGDLVRQVPEGDIEYIGRIDNQVKIRGFRIELGEIENALQQQIEVKDAVIIVEEDSGGDKSLAAYLILQNGTHNIKTLHSNLSKKLPYYMMPNHFFTLKQFPLTPNGKVDRKELVKLGEKISYLDVEYSPPITELEKSIAVMWSEILNIPFERIGANDNFFHLGGHSLKATQVIARIRHDHGIDLPLSSFFKASTVHLLARKINLEKKHQQKLLPDLMKQNRSSALTLSFAQERLWFLDQLLTNRAVYNIPLFYKLSGKLNFDSLESAFRSLISRHEVFRSSFENNNGSPQQIIAENLVFCINKIVCNAEQVDELALQEANLEFQLDSAPLLRAKLLTIDENENVLLLTVHHIVFDGWSIEILIKELNNLYNHYACNQPLVLADLPIQYLDYAVWQKNWLQGAVLEKQLHYWQKKLKNAPEFLILPTSFPRPIKRNYLGKTYNVNIPKILLERLNLLAEENQATLFMVLIAAINVLLYRYSNQTDIVVGSAIAGRKLEELENIIGFFVNSLALRTNLDGNPSFISLLNQVKNTSLEAYQNQDVPFEKLVDHLHVNRNLNIHPLFQVMIVLQNEEMGGGLSFTNVVAEEIKIDTHQAMFDLTFNIEENTEHSLNIGLSYATDLFEDSTIERMTGHLLKVIEAICADANQNIDGIDILTATEKHQQLVEWNQTEADYPKDKTIQQMFEEQVAETPNNIAVVFEGKRLTYKELNEHANQVAHYLRSVGVGPETIVAFCLERSLEMMVTILGIIKAGGAYLPIDPSYPDDRINYMLKDSNAALIISQSSLHDKLTGCEKLLLIEEITDNLAKQPITNLQPLTGTNNLAYIIYTSGSTGKPKGVMIEHKGLCNLAFLLIKAYQVQENSNVLQFATIAFDSAVAEMFMTLTKGATLYLIAAKDRVGSNLVNFLNQNQITIATIPPTIIADLAPEKIKYLKTLILAGEATNETLMNKWHTKCSVMNAYGPTESTVCTTTKDYDGKCSSTNIGKPISNAKAYILDQHLQLVPTVVVGELYIGGIGLARGYLNKPELTAEKFINNPFASEEDKQKGWNRLYKTGDLCRWLDDGNIEYIGRIDNQVKIRGFRIELGEIENAIRNHEGVKDAVVIAREDQPGDKYLAAYLIIKGEINLSNFIGELRANIAKILPEYMIPNAFEVLDDFPLTTNGKLDKKALPKPNAKLLAHEHGYLAPRNATEEDLVKVWSEVLGLPSDKISVNDNFFHIGGHSLKATQVIARIRDNFKLDMPLRDLFESPTIEGLAIKLSLLKDEKINLLPVLVKQQRGEHIPLSFAQNRLWFLDQLIANKALYNIPIAISMFGKLNIQALERAIQMLANRHEILRTCFKLAKGEVKQIIANENDFVLKLEKIDLSINDNSIQQKQVKELIESEVTSSFNLSKTPLICFKLITLNQEEHVLLLNMHHIVSDGWSLDVLFKEISLLYNHFSNHQPLALTDLPVQYSDYAIWQRKWLQGEVLNEQISYWKNKLSGAPELLALPFAKHRPQFMSYLGKRHNIVINQELSRKLKQIAEENQATLFMVLIAIINILLHRYSNQTDIVIGSPIAGRKVKETEGLVGFFVNTLVLRNNLADDLSFINLLDKVKNTTLEAYQNQDIPFEQLVDNLHISRNLNIHPLFQVMVSLQNSSSDLELNLSSLQTKLLAIDYHQAKFDLTIDFEEHKDGCLKVAIEYATDLFEDSTIKRMAGHLLKVIEAICADAHQNIGEIDILTATEKHQQLVEWNQTEADYPKDKTIQQLFEEQAEKTPDNIAVVLEDKRLTYKKLNEQANQFAHYLRSVGVGPETILAFCLERSLEMMVTILGIIKAGGAYLPIDPSYPDDRINYMLEDSNATLMISQSSLRDKITHCKKLLLIEEITDNLAKQPVTNLRSLASVNNLAYIIYTSGSTGKPKGVMIEHGSLVNLVTTQKGLIQISEVSRMLQFSSIGFDASVWEIFITITNGAALYVCNTNDRFGNNLVGFLNKQQISIALLSPAVIANLSLNHLVYLETIVIGGDTASSEIMSKCLEKAKVINAYGPTESTVCTTTKNYDGKCSSTNIGKPIGNAKAYILDQHLQLVPTGVIGELYIGGIGLARGYLNKPELTAEKFINNPFVAGQKIYKTGDLCRWLDYGNIEYIGRIDNQVKIRGFRIELGEIENAIRDHDAVKDVVVIALEDRPGDKYLAAYLIIKGEINLSNFIGELRANIAKILPEYMIPNAFEVLDDFPVTTNGKLDKKELPKPNAKLLAHEHGYLAPRNATEEDLVKVWSEVLGLLVDKISVNDNFFHIGGHSLLVVKLALAMENHGYAFVMNNIFNYPTITSLADYLDGTQQNQQTISKVELSETRKLMEDDTKLDLKINANIKFTPFQHEQIFLTGATGFLGAHLLADLITNWKSKVYCLVRADGLKHGMDRIINKLKEYNLWKEELSAGIVPVLGNLEQPNLGLDSKTFNEIAENVDQIFHVGALVNHVYSYQQLREANVFATKEIIKLASSCKVKPIHYVSTLSIFSGSKIAKENDLPVLNNLVHNGYIESKFVAEQILHSARSQQLPVNIYRTGNITGHSEHCLLDTNAAFCRMIKGCLQLNLAPEEEQEIDLMPVDYLTNVLRVLTKNLSGCGKNFHLFGEFISYKQIFNHLETLGYKLQYVEYKSWLESLRSNLQSGKDNALNAYLPVLINEDESAISTEYDSKNAKLALSNSHLPVEKNPETLIKNYLQRLISMGYL